MDARTLVSAPGGQTVIRPQFVESIGWLALLVGLSLSAADIVTGPWDHDGGFFLLRGSYIAQGFRPLIDYSTKYPPVVDIITALAVSVVRHRLAVAIALPLAWIAANTLATGLLTFRVTHDRAATVLCASLFPLFAAQNGGNHVTLELGVSLFALLAFAALADRETPLSAAQLALGGACLSAAALSKHPGVIAMLPAAALLASRRGELTRKLWVALGAGLALPPFAIAAWLSFDLAAIYRGLVLLVVEYIGKSAGRNPEVWGQEFSRAPATAMLFVVAIVIAASIASSDRRLRWVALAAAAGGAIEFLPRFVRDYPHYNLNIWPFLALILALGLGHRDVHRRMAILFVLATFVVVAYARHTQRISLGRSPLLAVFLPAAAEVERATPSGEVVRQYGAEPIIEFLAGRQEEKIDKGDETSLVWDGSGIYSTPPDAHTTVVVVDMGQEWIAPLVDDLTRRGFATTGSYGPSPSVLVLRHRTGAPSE